MEIYTFCRIPHRRRAIASLLLIVAILAAGKLGQCQDIYDDYEDDDGGGNTIDVSIITIDVPIIAITVYDRLMSLTRTFTKEFSNQLKFYIKDSDEDWNRAFNFSSNLRFLVNCNKKDGYLTQCLCNAVELKFYFNSFYHNSGETTSKINIVKPNKNYNLTSWVPGCEPGWACMVNLDQNVKLNDSRQIPARKNECHPCCLGFFCPYGITCMISRPLGVYFPLATFNKTSGVCDLYNYQLPLDQPNHTYGGIDMWANVLSTRQVFCPDRYYCPSTIQKISCNTGHYCRKGSISEIRCFKKSSCKKNSSNQDITIFGALVMVALCLLILIIYNFSGQILSNCERRQAKSREDAARIAREIAKNRERWILARDVAKENHEKLLRTLSRKPSNSSGKSHGSSDATSSKNVGLPPMEKESSSLTKVIQSPFGAATTV